MDRRIALHYVPIPAPKVTGTPSHDREEAIGVKIRFHGVGLALIAVAMVPNAGAASPWSGELAIEGASSRR